jgi:3D (Asp-Asp-Asp) domain-containing protein
MTGIVSTALMGFLVASSTPWVLPVDMIEAANAITEPTYPTYTVSMTGYNAVPSQTDGDPNTTASGAYSNPEVMAARSVDLKDELPFGTVIEVVTTSASTSPNCGIGVVEKHIGYRVIGDSMHSRKRNQIDLMFKNDKVVKAAGRMVNPAVAFGVCKNVEIRVIGKIDIKKVPKNQTELKIAAQALPKAVDQNLAIKK